MLLHFANCVYLYLCTWRLHWLTTNTLCPPLCLSNFLLQVLCTTYVSLSRLQSLMLLFTHREPNYFLSGHFTSWGLKLLVLFYYCSFLHIFYFGVVLHLLKPISAQFKYFWLWCPLVVVSGVQSKKKKKLGMIPHHKWINLRALILTGSEQQR